ncbi:MAG TPA: ABC transporter permease [Baekduia sp.]|nr:ABC transporter permease [Baekduia sp.]
MIAPLALIAALLAVWELYANSGGVDPLLLPAPTEIAQSLWTDRSVLAENALVTGGEIVLGLAVALTAGLLIAIALHLSGRLRRASYPLLIASQAVPIVAVAPLLIAWLGFGLLPKIVIIALVCFFPVVVTTLDGLQRTDPVQLRMIRSLGASRLQVLRRVELPSALPAALSGAKVAVTIGAIAAVFAEYAGSDRGLGHLLMTSGPQLRTNLAWATVFVLAALALACFVTLSALERRLTPWASPRKDPPR